jgi:hypothetical protein
MSTETSKISRDDCKAIVEAQEQRKKKELVSHNDLKKELGV